MILPVEEIHPQGIKGQKDDEGNSARPKLSDPVQQEPNRAQQHQVDQKPAPLCGQRGERRERQDRKDARGRIWVKAHMRPLHTRMVLLPLEPHPIVNPFDGIPLSIQPGGQIVVGKIAIKRAPSRDKRLPGKGRHQDQKQQRFCPAIAESFGACQPGAPSGPEKKT